MSFDPREYLRHIQVEVEYLLGSCAGLKLEEFLANETLRRAAVRSLAGYRCQILIMDIGVKS